MPLYFISRQNNLGNYYYARAALIFRTLYPWLYEVLAQELLGPENIWRQNKHALKLYTGMILSRITFAVKLDRASALLLKIRNSVNMKTLRNIYYTIFDYGGLEVPK